MPELSESNTGHSIETQLQETNLEVARAQLQKLDLEIENLKPKPKWYEIIVSFTPIITVLISVGGLVSGIFIFTSQQKADQISRDKMQFWNSYDQLLQFSSNPNVTPQRVVFLHDEIIKLIDSMYLSSEDKDKAKDTLKKRILSMINLECDYTQSRHVQLDRAGLESWTDYKEDLKTLLTKYYDALRQLHSRNREYIESLSYDPNSGYVRALSDPLDISLDSLVKGFTVRFELLNDEEKLKAIEDFGACINNHGLAADLFNNKSDKESISAEALAAAANPE